MATQDTAVQKAIMQDAVAVLGRAETFPNAPAIARETQRILQARTGNADPYRAVKQRDLRMALALLPGIERKVNGRDDRLYWALKAAATGNVLDSALYATHDIGAFDAEFERPFAVCDLPALQAKLRTAKSLLLIGDNTGETVFDVLLLRQFPTLRVTFAARSAPVINDATVDEALASGLGACATVISSGCDIPGTQLSDCSAEFLDRFTQADIVISKGQGNFETLSDAPRELFFLLKAKCPVIAGLLGVQVNDFVLRYQAAPQSAGEA